MARFGLKYGEASKIVKQARANLGIPQSCAWTEDLEEEACKLCGGESDNSNSGDGGKPAADDSVATANTGESSSTTKVSLNSTSLNVTTKKKKMAPKQHASSEDIGCWTPKESQKGKVSFGSKKVADLQHDTLLEGAEVERNAPKIPIRKSSNNNLEDSGVFDYNGEEDHCYESYEDADMDDAPLPVIRPLRRTDSRTKHA